jgi:iron complex outermembrane receptor protein
MRSFRARATKNSQTQSLGNAEKSHPNGLAQKVRINYQKGMRVRIRFILLVTSSFVPEWPFLAGANESLEPLQVSAMRLEVPAREIAARVERIDRERIRQSGATDLIGVLRREANLQVRSTSGNSARSEVSMGGFGENARQRTLVLLDGHRLNANDLSQLNWFSVPLALVESIEVIRGSQSATYGNHAVGGVIKINTLRPAKEKAGSLEASAGSFDSLGARGAYSQWIGGVGLALHGERTESDGYRQNGAHDTTAGGLRLDWGSTDVWKGYLSWNLAETDFGLPGDLNATELAANRRQSNEPNNQGEERASHGRAGVRVELVDDWAFDSRFGYLDRKVWARMPSFGFLSDTVYETFSISPSLVRETEERSSTIGIDYVDDRVGSDTNFDDSSLRRRTRGAFVSTSRPLFEEWSGNGSARVESVRTSGAYGGTDLNGVSENEWAGSLGLVRKLGGGNRAYGAVRRFYRYPATDEILVFFPTYSLNPDLRPETGYEAELGMDWEWESLTFGGRVFRQWMRDEIIYDSASFANLNLDRTRRVGLDFSLEWLVSAGLSAGMRYEYLRARIGGGAYGGAEVPLVPESLLRLFVNLDLRDDLSLRLGSSYVGKSFAGGDFANAGFELDDYWLHDLGVDYRLGEQATVFAGVDNLFDEEYLSTAYGAGLYPGAGRGGRVGLRYSF